MLKHLIVNDDEMVASDRMSFAETKSFISKQVYDLENRTCVERKSLLKILY